MSVNVNLEYVDPSDGLYKKKSVTLDVADYSPEEGGLGDQFYLKAAAAGVDAVYKNIQDVAGDVILGRLSSGRSNLPQSYVDAAFSTNGTTLSVTPAADIAGFEAGIPCVAMNAYGSVVGYFVPTVVAADFTLPGSGGDADGMNLAADCDVGFIVQQLTVVGAPLGERNSVGIKEQLERPNKPTIVIGSGAGPSIDVAINKPGTRNQNITHYDVYVSTESFKVLGNERMEPNRIPDASNVVASASSVEANVTTYGGGADAGGDDLGTGSTYYVVAVAKDGTGNVDITESVPSAEKNLDL